MQKRAGTAVAMLIATLVSAPIARAQGGAPKPAPSRTQDDLDIRVRIPGDVIREVHRLVDELAGSDLQREISEALREVTSSLTMPVTIDGREIRDTVRQAIREATQSLRYTRDGSWSEGQNKDYKSTQRDREVKTLQLGPDGQLSLDNIVGDITVTAGTGRDVTVEIVREAHGRTDADVRLGLDRVRVETNEQAGRASVRTLYPSDGHPNYSVDVRYTVTAPAGTQVSAHSVSGNVSVTGIRGDLSATTISGDVTVSKAARLSDARTTSGDVKLTEVDSDGSLNVSSLSGTVTALQVKARRLDISSISGDIVARDITCENGQLHTLTGETEFSGPLAPRGRYQFTTHSGNVHIVTDGKVGFALESSSFSGTLKSDFPIQSTTGGASRRTLNGTYGDGSAQIVVSSFSGNVTLTRK
jgi:DUF4097 and DUF4098 domain-containing protein YvlB